MPQAPQLVASVWSETQPVAQGVRPAAHPGSAAAEPPPRPAVPAPLVALDPESLLQPASHAASSPKTN